MAGDDFFDMSQLSVEGSLARGPEPDPWGVLSPAVPGGSPLRGRRFVVVLVAASTVLAIVAGAVAGGIAARSQRSGAQTEPLPASAPPPVEVAGTLADL